MPYSANGCLYNGLYVLFLPTTLMPGRSAASKKSEFSVLLAFGGADSSHNNTACCQTTMWSHRGYRTAVGSHTASAFQHISKRCIPPGCMTSENGGQSPFVSETSHLESISVPCISQFISFIGFWFYFHGYFPPRGMKL